MDHPVLLLLCHFTHLYNNWFSLESKEAIFWERQKTTCVFLRIKWFEIWVIFSKFFAFKKIFENNKLKKYLKKKKLDFNPKINSIFWWGFFFHIFPQFLIKYFWKFSAFWNDILAGKFKKDDIQAPIFFFNIFSGFFMSVQENKKIAIFGIFLVWKLMKTHFGAKI